MKRTHSESETDDIYSGDEKEGDDNYGGISRKRRRGIIEKRRRDRINNSLSELRRLVPAAFEKQGSAKLEKAEILQMTVDHLKMLHNKGLDALAYDPNKFAMDYHNIGFRECAAEVARYMVTVEGLDIQDPLRLRLMSHLQCYSAQREIATKQASSTWSWGSAAVAAAASTTPTGPSVPTGAPPIPYSSNPSISGFQGHMLPSHPSSHHPSGPSSHPPILLDQSHGVSAFSTPTSSNADIATSSCSSMGTMSPQGPRILSSVVGSHQPPSTMPQPVTTQPHTNYHLNLNAHTFPVNHHNLSSPPNLPQSHHLASNISPPNLGLSSNPAPSNVPYSASLQGASGMKPYRPWGAEIAY